MNSFSRPPITEAEKDLIVATYTPEISPVELAQRLNVSVATLYVVLRERDVPRTRRQHYQIQRHSDKAKRILARYAAKENTDQIAADFGTTAVAVRSLAWKCGVKRAVVDLGLSLAQIQVLICRINNGESARSIAKELGTSGPVVTTLLHRYGVGSLVQGPKPQAIKAMIDRYKEGVPLSHFIKEYGHGYETLRKAFRKAGVPLRDINAAGRLRRGRLTGGFTTNEKAFAKAENDPCAAYYCGLIMADGNLRKRPSGSWCLSISLQDQDRLHIEGFRDFLGTKCAIHNSWSYTKDSTVRYPQWRIAVTSKQIGDDLLRYGVTPRKCHTARVKVLEANRDFWRGVVDGDGCLGVYEIGQGRMPTPLLVLVGSKPLMFQFYEYAKSIAPNVREPRPQVRSWRFQTSGTKAVKVVTALYKGAMVALPRKMAIAEQIIGH